MTDELVLVEDFIYFLWFGISEIERKKEFNKIKNKKWLLSLQQLLSIFYSDSLSIVRIII